MATRLVEIHGNDLYYEDYSEVGHLLTGTIIEGSMTPRLKVKGDYLRYRDHSDVVRQLLGSATEYDWGGNLKNKTDLLCYKSFAGIWRCIALAAPKPTTREQVSVGTCVWNDRILNQCMITRTPNGDLYASCGDMGQNHDLDTSAGHPLKIWYSDDDGATWAESLVRYCDGWYWGGGNNGLCIASNSQGNIHGAYAVRRVKASPSEIYIVYFTGKHGDWGANQFVQYHSTDDVTDALPKVTSLCIDSSDNVYILYEYRDDEYDTYIGRLLWYDSSWHSETLYIDSHATFVNSRLVVDGNNKLHLVYVDTSEEKYYYRNKPSGGSWSSPVWIGMGTYLNTPAIAVDENNNLHLAIHDTTDGKGYYRQRLANGTWTDIEEFLGIFHYSPSISIPVGGTVYIVAHKVGTLIVRKRDPDTGEWSTDKSWATSAQGTCMLHSYYPISGGQHVCIFQEGWAFHTRIGDYNNFYYADP